jgi:uncharacterized protein (TIRG00374 family)
MKTRAAVISLLLITSIYLAAIIWLDAKSRVFDEMTKLWSILPVLVAMSLFAYLARFIRWRWLLVRAGYTTPFTRGLLAYLSGFAFTATPGKLGELVRIRYFAPQGVPASQVLAAFVYERVCDLLVVLAFAAMLVSNSGILIVAIGFVSVILVAVLAVVINPHWLSRASAWFRHYHIKRAALMLRVLHDGLRACRQWFRAKDITAALLLGCVAWGSVACSFLLLITWLGIGLPVTDALAIYPLAMLAGAASMLPGGLGSTEATIVLLLSGMGSPVALATLAAIGIRLSTLWLAIVLGLAALVVMESRMSANRGQIETSK